MTKTVLIVEDNELNMKLFNDLVETRGHKIVQTRSGVEAVDIARRHRPDLILMDIQLPEVSGLEVTQWLKDDEELRHIPVIAITAFAMKGDEEKILARRLRGLSVEADLGREVLRDDRPLSRSAGQGVTGRASAVSDRTFLTFNDLNSELVDLWSERSSLFKGLPPNTESGPRRDPGFQSFPRPLQTPMALSASDHPERGSDRGKLGAGLLQVERFGRADDGQSRLGAARALARERRRHGGDGAGLFEIAVAVEREVEAGAEDRLRPLLERPPEARSSTRRRS